MSLKKSFLKGMVTGLGLSADFLAGRDAEDMGRQYLQDTTGVSHKNSWQKVGMYLADSMKVSADTQDHESK